MKEHWIEARLAGYAQQWQNLVCEVRSSRILRPGFLLRWECNQPPLTTTPIQFFTRNKKQDLQKAVDSLVEKVAIEPVHMSHSLGFFSRLFLVLKKTRDLRLVIPTGFLNKLHGQVGRLMSGFPRGPYFLEKSLLLIMGP